MQHKNNKICRIILREDGTRLLRLNHYLSSTTNLESSSNDRSWIWGAQDFSDNEPGGVFHSFAIRFKTKALAEQFENMFILAKCVSEKTEETRQQIEPQLVQEEEEEKPLLSEPVKEEKEQPTVSKEPSTTDAVAAPFVFPRTN